jgi:C4-dicarboxylate transporter DctM subunit
MTNTQVGLSMFAGMLVLMALRVPIAVAMFVPGAAGYVAMAGAPAWLNHLKSAGYARLAFYDLSVIPLFMLMGGFATHGGLTESLFKFANSLLGRFRGGMAMAGIVACAVFGSLCGSSVATTATVAQVALPEMRRANYSGRLATASLAAGGTLGILLPPSITLVIYAILTEQNVAKLFAAAYVPGLIAAVGYMLAVAVYVRLYPGHAPVPSRPASGEVARSAMSTWPILVIFLIVFGGIYGGVFLPTEGASIGTVATLILSIARRGMNWEKFRRSLLSTAVASGMIFGIFLGADMMNAALALTQMPATLARMVGESGFSPVLIMVGIMLFYIALGCVMDELSMIMLTIPVIFPIVMHLDFFGLDATAKAIWFAILILMVVEIGMIFPPVGLNVYIMNGLARDVPMAETYRGVVPFLVSDALRMAILIAFPGLTLWAVQFVR